MTVGRASTSTAGERRHYSENAAQSPFMRCWNDVYSVKLGRFFTRLPLLYQHF